MSSAYLVSRLLTHAHRRAARRGRRRCSAGARRAIQPSNSTRSADRAAAQEALALSPAKSTVASMFEKRLVVMRLFFDSLRAARGACACSPDRTDIVGHADAANQARVEVCMHSLWCTHTESGLQPRKTAVSAFGAAPSGFPGFGRPAAPATVNDAPASRRAFADLRHNGSHVRSVPILSH
jgi:hypothetical protein